LAAPTVSNDTPRFSGEPLEKHSRGLRHYFDISIQRTAVPPCYADGQTVGQSEGQRKGVSTNWWHQLR